MKQLERLLFLQGGRCFFCKDILARSNASVEHLNAIANGGANLDSNCVACCKAVNAALGSLSIKEKIQVFLNQGASFVCPANSTNTDLHPIVAEPAKTQPTKPPTKKKVPNPSTQKPITIPSVPIDQAELVFIKKLLRAHKSPPATEATLKRWINGKLQRDVSSEQLSAFLVALKRDRVLIVNNKKLSYCWTYEPPDPPTSDEPTADRPCIADEIDIADEQSTTDEPCTCESEIPSSEYLF